MQSLHSFVLRFHSPSTGLLLIRLALGIAFLYHGWDKFTSLDQTVAFFGSIGLGAFWAYLVAFLETFGGIALILGLVTRYAAVLLAAEMAVAILKVHLSNGFSLANVGYEYAFVLLLCSIALFASGAGSYSVDARMMARKQMM